MKWIEELTFQAWPLYEFHTIEGEKYRIVNLAHTKFFVDWVLLLSLDYSGAPLRRTPSRLTKLSIIERVSSGQGFIIHYVGYIWDSVSVYYRGMRGVL